MAAQKTVIQSVAYGLFLEELERHLAFARQLLEAGQLSNTEQSKILGARFHTIRGGAGFFGLNEIVSTAKELEIMLLDDGFSPEAGAAQVTHLVERLSDLTLDLPRPQPSPS